LLKQFHECRGVARNLWLGSPKNNIFKHLMPEKKHRNWETLATSEVGTLTRFVKSPRYYWLCLGIAPAENPKICKNETGCQWNERNNAQRLLDSLSK